MSTFTVVIVEAVLGCFPHVLSTPIGFDGGNIALLRAWLRLTRQLGCTQTHETLLRLPAWLTLLAANCAVVAPLRLIQASDELVISCPQNYLTSTIMHLALLAIQSSVKPSS